MTIRLLSTDEVRANREAAADANRAAQVMEDYRLRLIADADASHAEFPQYANHWDDWGLARVSSGFSVRGVRYERGELVLIKPVDPTDTYGQPSGFVTCHLPNWCGSGRGMDCSVNLLNVSRLG